MRKRQTRRNTNNKRKRARKTIKKKGGTSSFETPTRINSENISIHTIKDFKKFIKNVRDPGNFIQKFTDFVMRNVETYPEQKDSVYRMLQRIFDVQLNLPNTVQGSEQRDNRQQGTFSGVGLNLGPEMKNKNNNNDSETEVDNNSNNEE